MCTTIKAIAVALATGLAACSDTSTVSSPDRSSGPPIATFVKGPKSLPDRGPMLFSALITGDRELFSVNEDGTGLTRLTNSPSPDDLATYSPDGSRIVFVSNRSGRPQLYTMNSDGTGVKQITDFTNDYNVSGAPTWSPDGKKIVTGLVDATGPLTRIDVFVLSPNGMIQTRLTSEGTANTQPTFSPDGKKIAFASNRDPDGLFDIWIMDADGANPTRPLNCEAGINCRAPAWSPDGSKIAFTRRPDSGGIPDVMVMAPNGGQVFKTELGYHDPFWSADGVKLAMVFDDAAAPRLATVFANGTGYANGLQLVGGDIRAGSWSR